MSSLVTIVDLSGMEDCEMVEGFQDYLNNFRDDVWPWDAVFWRPREVR